MKTLVLVQCISIWITAPSRSSQCRPSSGNRSNSSLVNVPSGTVQRPADSLVNSVGRRDRLSLLHLDLKAVLWPPAQVERAVGGHLVQPLVLRGVRRLLHHFRRLSGLLRDLAHDADEVIERLDRLRLRRLDHQRLGHDQREVDRRRVDTEVEDALGDVERPYSLRLLPAGGEDGFMHAGAVAERLVVEVAQAGPDVVGGQDGVLADLAQPRRAVHADVGVGADEHAEVAVEGMQATDALPRLEQLVLLLTVLRNSPHTGPRQELRQILAHSHWTRAGTAAAMWRGEGLVQVEVHDVDADVAGSRDAEDGVEVRTVVVDQTSRFMDGRDDFL